jgi:hypothetical protein
MIALANERLLVRHDDRPTRRITTRRSKLQVLQLRGRLLLSVSEQLSCV